MKISIDVRIVKDPNGKRALRVWPEIEGTDNVRTALVVLVVALLATASLVAIAATPDTVIEPTITLIGGY